MTARVSTSRAGDRTVYYLHDDASGASASILPSYGFNLFDLRLPIGGEVRPVVAAAPDFAENPSRPARNGFPILFPFPGRIRDARYTFEGKDYELVANKPPHAIHGFAHEAEWDVIEHTAYPERSTIVGQFQISKHAPGAIGRWPADAILEVRYTLEGANLELTAIVRNPSDRPLPWGFGLHSYFYLPFDRRSDLSGAKLSVEASEYWVLEDSLPTGGRKPVDWTRFDYRQGRSMAGLSADDALTGLAAPSTGGTVLARLMDERLDAELRVNYHLGPGIREVVVFTPPVQPGVIAVEPYTQMADAFALRDRGVDSGMQVLPPGQCAVIDVGFTATVLSTDAEIGSDLDPGL